MECKIFMYSVLLQVARGGLTPAGLLSPHLWIMLHSAYPTFSDILQILRSLCNARFRETKHLLVGFDNLKKSPRAVGCTVLE